MATIKVRALNDESSGMEWGRVVWGPKGQPFCFKYSPKGTADADVVETDIGNMDKAKLKALIEAAEGVVIVQNPKWDDVKTDDGTNGDASAGDGINEGTRYNWAQYGKLFEVL